MEIHKDIKKQLNYFYKIKKIPNIKTINFKSTTAELELKTDSKSCSISKHTTLLNNIYRSLISIAEVTILFEGTLNIRVLLSIQSMRLRN